MNTVALLSGYLCSLWQFTFTAHHDYDEEVILSF